MDGVVTVKKNKMKYFFFSDTSEDTQVKTAIYMVSYQSALLHDMFRRSTTWRRIQGSNFGYVRYQG